MKPILARVLGPVFIALALLPARPVRADDLGASPSAAEDTVGAAPAPMVGVGPATEVTVPFLFEGGHIIIDAAIDGHATKPFLFDTGARTIVTPDVAKELDLPLDGSGTQLGGVGPDRVGAADATVDSIAIGAATVNHLKVHVAELRNVIIDRGARPRAAGLIGMELLRACVVRIDYGKGLLTFISVGMFQPPTDGFALPLSLPVTREGLVSPLMPVEIEHIPGQFMVDTGSNGQIFLAARFEGDHKLVAHYPKTIQFLIPGGIGGRAAMRMGLGDSLSLGPTTLSTPLVYAPADERQSRPGALFFNDGVIGNGLLDHFIVTIDYKGGHIYFQAPRGTVLMPRWNGTGIIADKPEHNSFEIIDILPGTAAERAGLRRGERITTVDGHPASDLSIGDFGELNTAIATPTLTIETADGRKIDLAIGQILP